MCERTCPACKSTEHYDGYGMAGSYLVCTGCHTMLAIRADEQAAPLGMTEAEAEAWVSDRTWVLAGAEAVDPKDDEIWTAFERVATNAGECRRSEANDPKDTPIHPVTASSGRVK